MDAMMKWRQQKMTDRNASPIECLIHQQRVLSHSSMMCVLPCEYMAPPYEYVEHGAGQQRYG